MAAGAQGVGADVAARISSRKFMLAMLIQCVGSAGLFTGKIDGATFVALSGLTLSIYGGLSIGDKKLNPAAQP